MVHWYFVVSPFIFFLRLEERIYKMMTDCIHFSFFSFFFLQYFLRFYNNCYAFVHKNIKLISKKCSYGKMLTSAKIEKILKKKVLDSFPKTITPWIPRITSLPEIWLTFCLFQQLIANKRNCMKTKSRKCFGTRNLMKFVRSILESPHWD